MEQKPSFSTTSKNVKILLKKIKKGFIVAKNFTMKGKLNVNFKKLFISLVLTLSLTTVTVAQEAAPEGDYFGDIKFGSTKEEVKNHEKDSKLVLEHDNELTFNETSEFLGSSQNSYSFDNDGKMNAGAIYIVNDHKDLAKYIEDFNKINEAFKQMYGEPDQDAFNTDDEALLNDPAKLAQAIKEGKVVASTVWKKENFTISHILGEQMTTDDLDEDTKKISIITPICHLVLGQLNSAEEEAEAE